MPFSSVQGILWTITNMAKTKKHPDPLWLVLVVLSVIVVLLMVLIFQQGTLFRAAVLTRPAETTTAPVPDPDLLDAGIACPNSSSIYFHTSYGGTYPNRVPANLCYSPSK
jgi:hypothetical protein